MHWRKSDSAAAINWLDCVRRPLSLSTLLGGMCIGAERERQPSFASLPHCYAPCDSASTHTLSAGTVPHILLLLISCVSFYLLCSSLPASHSLLTHAFLFFVSPVLLSVCSCCIAAATAFFSSLPPGIHAHIPLSVLYWVVCSSIAPAHTAPDINCSTVQPAHQQRIGCTHRAHIPTLDG